MASSTREEKLLSGLVVILVIAIVAFNFFYKKLEKEHNELQVKYTATVEGFEMAATLYCHALENTPATEAVVDPE